jgi:uncharacterized membrane protein
MINKKSFASLAILGVILIVGQYLGWHGPQFYKVIHNYDLVLHFIGGFSLAFAAGIYADKKSLIGTN